MTDSLDLDRICRDLVAGAADAIIYSDREGLIRLWNAGAERIFGYCAEEALGQSLDLIIPEKLRERHWEGYARTMASGVTRYGADSLLSVPAIRKDGSRLSVAFTILPFHGEGGEIIGVGAILRDVTPQYEELKALRQRLSGLG
nr:PAS domain S-box protein [uncultured Holophaga sp.]